MKIAVCDDCMKDALYLKGFLGGHEVRVYSDACNLFADMEDKKERYDLYLLDIYMEGPIDGIELAKKIRIWQEEAAICFVSTSNDFYREAYDLYAIWKNIIYQQQGTYTFYLLYGRNGTRVQRQIG